MLRFTTQLCYSTVLFAGLFACSKRGCTDPLASNYNPAAQKNNGNCVYTPGIQLIGDDTLHLPVGSEFIDEGAIAIVSALARNSALKIFDMNTNISITSAGWIRCFRQLLDSEISLELLFVGNRCYSPYCN